MPPASDSVRRARPLLGTFVEITVADASPSDMHAAVEAAFLAVAEVHRLMSFHDPHSDISRLNGEAWQRAVSVHDWTFQVLQAALDLHRRSRGVFDIAVAPVLQDMGLLPRLLERVPIRLNRERALDSLLGRIFCGKPVSTFPENAPADRSSGPEKFATGEAVTLLPDNCVRFARPCTRIDLGGIAKGFAVDRAIDVLRDHGMPRGLVNAGGDLAAFGPHPETICIRDPRDPRRLLLRVEIDNQALASSGHFFDPFRSASALGSTIIDPCTRKPVLTIDAATVRAPSCMLADALTKVVMVAGSSATALLEHCCASALVVSAAGDVQMTPDLQNAVCLAA